MEHEGRLWRIVQGLVDDALGIDEREESQSAEWQRAWQELSRELESEVTWGAAEQPLREPPEGIPVELHSDYRNLDAPLTATLAELHRAYRSALREYHPDRYGDNPRKFAIATEVAMRLNRSWQRIRVFHAGYVHQSAHN